MGLFIICSKCKTRIIPTSQGTCPSCLCQLENHDYKNESKPDIKSMNIKSEQERKCPYCENEVTPTNVGTCPDCLKYNSEWEPENKCDDSHNEALVLYNAGVDLLAEKKYCEAYEYFKNSLQLNPEDEDTLINFACAAACSDKLEPAKIAILKCIELNPACISEILESSEFESLHSFVKENQNNLINQNNSNEQTPPATGLSWGIVAASAAAFFLLSNQDKLKQEGGFIYLIGAVVLAILSANMMTKK